ncbi:MAG: hypothetical protein KF798_06790 [Candidatus Paracaedibacteraceae bacterium]|nr:hypothetical protein [Candidatus Paracaedibacteraceae bacterium]
MSIYLYLCQPTHTFEELAQQLPIKLLELSIDHREGRIPVADLVLPATENLPDRGWAYIATDDRGGLEPLFKGQFSGIPKAIDEQTKRISLYATLTNLESSYQKVMRGVRDNQFVQSGKLFDYLEFTTQLPCYNRLGSDFILSDLFKGRHQRTLNREILANSLKLQLSDTPLPSVEVTLTKEWTQICRGEANLLPQIEAQFPQGRICTLSASGLLSSWPKTGQLLGRSGYAVVNSNLMTFTPSKTGVLGHYPLKTPEIKGQVYKINWLKGTLVVEWCYRQKRREIVTFTMMHKNRYLENTQRPPRTIKLRLTNGHTESVMSSFFDTPEGRDAVDQALDIARSHLAYSARALEITCQIPFVDGLDLTLDHNIKIIHSVIPQGEIQGKLVAYRLERHYNIAVATLRILVATGTGEANDSTYSIQPVSDIEGLVDAKHLAAEQVIDHIVVHNHAYEQISLLQTNPDQDLTTWIDLNLKDLRSHDVLERSYTLNTLNWSAPNLILN